MAEKRELKIRALIPDSETALGKVLEERGFEVKPYSHLKLNPQIMNQLKAALEGMVPKERALFFYTISHVLDRVPPPSAIASSAEPSEDPNVPFAISRGKEDFIYEILYAQRLRMRLEKTLTTQNRNRIDLVLMVPRESDVGNHIPPSAYALTQPADETEINALADKCIANFEVAAKETRQQTQETLDLEMLPFDIIFEDDPPSAEISPLVSEAGAGSAAPAPHSADVPPLKSVIHGEIEAESADSIPFSPDAPHAIEAAPRSVTHVLHRDAYFEAGSGDESDVKSQVVDALFRADGSFEMMQDELSGILPGKIVPADVNFEFESTAPETPSPLNPASPSRVVIADGASFKGTVDMKVAERQQALRLEDREQVIQILARYLMPLDLARFSKPKEGFDPQGRVLFQNHEPNHELISSSDWTTSRGLAKSAEVLGVQSLIAFQNIAQNAARPHVGRKFEPVTLHLGPGDGNIMNEFATAESHLKHGHHKPTRHVGMARSLLFGLSDLLDRSIATELPDSTSQALRQFNQRITLLLQREYGRFGRMKINLNLPEDQVRLKDYLVRLAKNPETIGYAQGVRETLSTTGKYADDKPDLLSDEEIQCFAEYTTDPPAFFEKYYGSFFNPESQQNLNALLNLGKNDILFGDFKDIPSLLEKAGAFMTFAYSVKGFSHLEDYDYGVAFNEVAARLVPGGIFIDDGVVESYTWHQRIEPLREVQKNLGNDYRFYLIGNEKAPISVIVQRGIRSHKGAHCDFSLPEITKNCPGSKVVCLKNYETVWPEAALRNKITKHIKDQLLRGLVRGIADNTLRLECAQTWRQTCLKEIDPLFTGIFERTVTEWRTRKANRSGHIQRKDRQKLSNDKYFDEIFRRFASDRGEPLDRFIQSLLLRLYRERREGHRSGKEARKEGESD